ncbi:hypothetical protein C4K35_4109 [Pseudomonas chlororaphis subsp. piscium]|uniref:IpaC/SipC family type III secretion system effector n=1 Tax=Pseudomonas chlororaphis TaxID=587753 RepID=UPI000F5775CC|nr:IpaC/SipC family type III secretion system effector [Pseudomonas chlororaphis]AZC51688.1 hypothetical protein C4K35_4109 [Pseudomonas chlororaphis subsp. piscium]
MEILHNGLSVSVSRSQIPEPATKAILDPKPPMQVASLGAKPDTQVLNIATKPLEKLNGYLDTSTFSESESQVMMALFLASVVTQEKEQPGAAEKDPVSDLMSFDPGAWEKHIGVLVAAIVAVNIARKSSAEMSGAFTQMAYEAAVAQGVAIMAGGEAAMWAAVSGAVVASTMAISGAGFSIRGQNQKHLDIKTNQTDAVRFEATAERQRLNLKVRPADMTAGAPKTVTGINVKGELETIELQTSSAKLDSRDRAVLESEIRSTVAKATEARMKSALQEKTYNRNMTIGGAFSAMAMMISSGLTAILRLQEYSERQNEVLHQSEHNLNKAVSDAANQVISEDAALISKMLDQVQHMVDSLSATMNAVASARV